MQRSTVFFLILFLSFGLALAQPEVSVVADNVATGSPLYYDHTPNVARSSNGDLVAVWKSADNQVVFSKYDPSFMTWSPAVPISNAGDQALKAGIAADDNGNLYCTWQQRETSGEDWAIFFSKYDGASWTTPVNLTGNDAENEECGIAVNSLGHVFVAWNTDAEPDSSEWVLCIKSEDGGSTWSNPDTLSSNEGIIGGTSTTSGRPVLAKAAGGKMVCAWHEEPDGHPQRESFIAQYDGASWSDEIVYIDVADSANSMYPTIAADSDDNIYMMYVSFISVEEVKMLKKAWGDAAWPNEPSVLFSDPQVTKPNLVIDSNDDMYVIFRRDNAADTTYGLEEEAYMTSDDLGVTWSDQVRLSRENYDAGYGSVALRPSGEGVDFLWRESYVPNSDDADTTAILHARINTLTSIEGQNRTVLKDFQLQQNYPNPFNPSTQITFNIPQAGIFELAVYDLTGRKIRVLESGKLTAGQHTAEWNAVNESGRKAASGIYFYQLKGKNISLTKKMVLVK